MHVKLDQSRRPFAAHEVLEANAWCRKAIVRITQSTGLRRVQGAVSSSPLKELDGFPCGGDLVEDRPEVRVGVVAVEGGRGDASGSQGVQAVADAGSEKR
jgi:hypothetical protein